MLLPCAVERDRQVAQADDDGVTARVGRPAWPCVCSRRGAQPEPDPLAVVDERLHAEVGGEQLDHLQPATGLRLLVVAAPGRQHRVAVDHLDAHPVRRRLDDDPQLGVGMDDAVGHELGGQQRGGVDELGRADRPEDVRDETSCLPRALRRRRQRDVTLLATQGHSSGPPRSGNPPEGSRDPFPTMLTTHFGATDRPPAHPFARIGRVWRKPAVLRAIARGQGRRRRRPRSAIGRRTPRRRCPTSCPAWSSGVRAPGRSSGGHAGSAAGARAAGHPVARDEHRLLPARDRHVIKIGYRVRRSC